MQLSKTLTGGGGKACSESARTELEREKGKAISFSICNILNKEEDQEQSDIEESDDEGDQQ